MISGGASVASSTNRVVGITFTDEYSVAKLKDGLGDTLGMDPYGRERKATLEIVPYDANGNAVTARSNIKLPDPCSVVTISDTGIAFIDGYWNAVGSPTVTPSSDGYLKVSIPLEQVWNRSTGLYGALT